MSEKLSFDKLSMTVTVSARSGLRIALCLLWDSLVALVRRDTVTFYAGQDDVATYSVEVVNRKPVTQET